LKNNSTMLRSTPRATRCFRNSARRRTLNAICFAASSCLFPASGAHATTIVTDPNTTDTPLFIQLLGINNAGTIVGYTGMGTANPNILTLPGTTKGFAATVPEPATLLLSGLVLFAILAVHFRRGH
jgi:hypothetical protein